MRRLAALLVALLCIAGSVAGCGGSGRRVGGVGPCVQQPSGALSCRGLDNTSAPTIGGITTQGDVLAASSGTWNATPSGFSYQWLDCNASGLNCTPIPGATQSTYTLQGSDVGDTIQVWVLASKGAQTTTAYSAVTGVVSSSGSFSCPNGVRCFFIAASGSDSNNGTSESTPWAHAPGMATFTGTYTHQTGDEFIFKGGDTWGNSSFPLHPSAGGSSAHPDYYGVDPSWFTGASFTQPTFDAQSSNIGAGTTDEFFNLQGRDHVEVDDIHFANWTASSITGGYGSCAVVEINGDLDVTVNRITVTGMALDSSADAQNATCAVVFGNTSGPNFAGTSTLENSTITGGGNTYGVGAWAIANVENNTISGIPNMVYPAAPANGTGQISGNLLSGCISPSAPTGASNLHGDMILVNESGNPSTLYIHDNVLHDTGASGTNECESMWVGNPGETDYIWNNVIYNLHGTGQLKLNNNVTPNQTEGPYFIWDNTLSGASDGATDCITGHSGEITAAATIENNLCVSSSGSTWDDSFCSGGGSACITADHNVLLTPTQMSTDVTGGLFSTSPFQWAEASVSAPTVGAGTSLASNCSGALASLCSDTTYAGARSTVSRPGTNGWDVGAYQEP